MKTQLLLSALCFAISLPAQATPVLKPEEISDQELAQLRGKFVMPGQIIHFGITMISSWQDAHGQVLGASVSMQAQQGMFQPVFRVTSLNKESAPDLEAVASYTASQSQGQVSGGAGLHNVSGASQSIQAAGDNNVATNEVQMNVSRADQAPALDTSGTALTNQVTTQTSSGNVQVTPGSQGVEIAIQSTANGSALQRIGAGTLLQNSKIMSSGNVVKNLAALEVVLREHGGTVNAVNCDWDQLRALRPAGI